MSVAEMLAANPRENEYKSFKNDCVTLVVDNELRLRFLSPRKHASALLATH